MRYILAHAPRQRLFHLAVVGIVLIISSGLVGCSDAPTSVEKPGGLRGATTVQLPGITATQCQYGGEYPDCKPKPIDGGGTTSPVAPASGGGGGGSEPPPDSTADKPCATRDSILNSPAVQAGFTDLWSKSNPDAEMSQRYEKGGWIIRDATGRYTVQPFPDAWTLGPALRARRESLRCDSVHSSR